ncbi:MAG: hypothetical protein FJX55_07370 [Alphaproteobacteria bacterium]|nr:hypothetical protein [Alphaproteobacteria bacterium]
MGEEVPAAELELDAHALPGLVRAVQPPLGGAVGKARAEAFHQIAERGRQQAEEEDHAHLVGRRMLQAVQIERRAEPRTAAAMPGDRALEASAMGLAAHGELREMKELRMMDLHPFAIGAQRRRP